MVATKLFASRPPSGDQFYRQSIVCTQLRDTLEERSNCCMKNVEIPLVNK